MGEVDYSPEVSKAAERQYTWRIALKVSNGESMRRRELTRLANKWNMDISDLNNKQSIKMNIERSRREYLNLRAQQEALRRKYLETTGRIMQQKREKQKRQFKCCNNTFGKCKLKAINRVEYRKDGELIQVSTKNEVENAIMRENSSRFRLAYSLLILEKNMCKELGPSGEGNLSQDILNSQEQLHA